MAKSESFKTTYVTIKQRSQTQKDNIHTHKHAELYIHKSKTK